MEFPQPNRNPAPSYPNVFQGQLYAEPNSDDPRSDPKRRRSTKRKQTLIQLLDELTALKEEELDDGPAPDVPAAQGVHERIKNQPIIVDSRLQDEGAQLFFQFNKRIRQVDEGLLSFGNAVRPLGSSVGLISSSWNLRTRLQQILHLFRENASDIFPDKVKKEPVEPMKPLSSRKRSKTRMLRRSPTRQIRPPPPLTSDLEEFPKQFLLFAKDLVSFLHFLHDIPEFTDESLNASVLSFEGDLKYWASCLTEFEGQFQYPAIKRYVNDLTREMDEHLENVRDALRVFVSEGVNTIRTAQDRTQTGLQNLSTVATFFSGVTATTFQYTFDQHETFLETLVNTLWIASLVFSIASSINSQLAYHWRAAMYRSPRSAVPWWVSIWLTRTPLIFLVVSVMTFSAGLVCFTYSSEQGHLVTICSTIFTAVTSLALLAVSVWFAAERMVFARTKGSRWLADYVRERRMQFFKATGLTWFAEVPPEKLKRAATWSGGKLSRVGTSVFNLGSTVLGRTATKTRSEAGSSYDDSEEYAANNGTTILPMTNSPKVMHSRKISDASTGSNGRRQVVLSTPTSRILDSPSRDDVTASPIQEIYSPMSMAASPQSPDSPELTVPTKPGARARFKAAAWKIGKTARAFPSQSSAGSSTSPGPTRRQTTGLTLPDRQGSEGGEKMAMRPSRLAYIIPALKRLTPTQMLTEHQGLVRHLQFSPDGKYLATCSWDRKAIIWKVGPEFQLHKTLGHYGTGFIGQVAWAPDGVHLLTKMTRGVKLWAAGSGVCTKTFSREHKVEAVTWLPSGKAFACVEHSNVYIMDLQGKVKSEHHLERLEIHDVAFTPDEKRMVLVGTLKMSKEQLQPSKSRAEKRIIVYDLKENKVENQVPILENIRDVTISADGSLVLVSYEDTAPPEVWRIDMVRDEARLALLHTYIPAAKVDFAGPSYFAGQKEQFIICAGKKGDIHIWDRETGLLLHSLQGANHAVDDGDLTSIAWNHNQTGQYMFATATHDGTVRIWTAPTPPETQPPSRSESPTPFIVRSRSPPAIPEVPTVQE